jgi:hypothetical protein
MRTLKKTLCLVLALALCFSFASVAFADYSDYTDADQVGAAYEEAVAVLIGTGIVNGMTDTTIAPTGSFTREQAAKIVAYMTLGETVADKLTATSDPFDDVAATRWSAGYIQYCVAQGYVKGYGTGKFGPTDELTGFQFAAMLLRVLGYGTNGEYEGSSWAINVAKDALNSKVGIFTGDTSAANNETVQRQQAMLMAFNALNYTASGSTSEYVVKDENGDVLYKGTDAVTALLMKQADEGNTLSVQTTNAGSLGDTVYGLQKSTSTDAFGRVSTVYVDKNEKDATKATYTSIDPTAVVSYTTTVTKSALAAALGAGNTDANGVNVTVITNGVAAEAVKINKTTDGSIGQPGDLIEVYKTGDKAFDVVIIETKVAKVTEGMITKADASKDQDALLTIDGKAFKTDAFKKDDIVLYTVGSSDGTTADTIVTVVKADFATGKVTASAANYVRIDGVQKVLSHYNLDSATIGTTAGYKVSSDEYTYYYDTYGNIVAAVKGVTATVETKYTYVFGAASKAATAGAGSNLFESTEGTAAAAQAKIIDLATGEIKVVNIGIVKNTAGKYMYATAAGAAGDVEVAADNVPVYTKAGVYSYVTLDDGSYVLSKAEAGESVDIKKNVAAVGTYVATSATVLNTVTYETKDGAITSASVTTTTGIANFPATEKALTGAIIVADATTKVISSITVVEEKAAAQEALNYAIYAGVGETDSTGTKYAFVVNGEKVEYYGTEDPEQKVGTVVTLTLTDGKIAKKADVATANVVVTDKTLTVVDTTFVTDGTNAYYFAEAGVKVFKKNSDGTYTAATVAAGDKVDIYGASVSAVDFILIVG